MVAGAAGVVALGAGFLAFAFLFPAAGRVGRNFLSRIILGRIEGLSRIDQQFLGLGCYLVGLVIVLP